MALVVAVVPRMAAQQEESKVLGLRLQSVTSSQGYTEAGRVQIQASHN